jgi:hypothetical protein
MIHVMVDIECLGKDLKNAPMIQLAGVKFDKNFDPVEGRSWNISIPKDKIIERDTMEWWLETNPALLLKILQGEKCDPKTAVGQFNAWLGEKAFLWAKPITFDCMFIAKYFLQYMGFLGNIHWKRFVDMRSLLYGVGVPPSQWGKIKPPDGLLGQDHEALFDCYEQLYVLKTAMGGNPNPITEGTTNNEDETT